MQKLTTTLVLILLLCTAAFGAQEKKAEKAAPAKAEKAAPAKAEKAAPVAVDDATLTTNVKDKLSKTPSLKEAEINVAVKDKVVTLTGKVKNGGLKGVATNVAKSVKGVEKVDNQLATEAGVKKATKEEATKKEPAPKKEATPKKEAAPAKK